MLKLSDLNLSLETAKLKNGIKIVNFRKSGAPLAIRCLFFAGSRFDQIAGTAHFVEHILVAGSKKFPTKDKFQEYVENYGGYINANTGIDVLGIDLSLGDPKDINVASEIMKEAIFNPLFDEKIIDTERGAILRELSRKNANPDGNIWDINRKLLFQNTILGETTIGTVNSIISINKKDLINYYQQNILSGQLILITSGDISINTIKKEFQFLEKINYCSKTPIKKLETNSNKRILIEKYTDNNQITFTYSFHIGNILDITNPAIKIIQRYLSDSLMALLRYKNGLIYEITTESNNFFDTGFLSFKTSTSKENFSRTISLIESKFKQFHKNDFISTELVFIKNKIIKSLRRQLQTSESIVNFHAYRQFINNDRPWTIEDFTQSIENVDNKLIINTAQKYLSPEKSYLAICGNIDENEISQIK